MELIPWLVAAYAAIWVVVYFGNRLFMYFPVIQQLGAETLWLLYLIVSDNQMGPCSGADRANMADVRWGLA